MIKINKIEEKHPFPTIDFKFQNTGNGKAFLHEFAINIKSIKIDVTPSLKFRYEIRNNELIIIVKNDGYGPVINGSFNISEVVLDKLLIHNLFQFNVNSDEEKEIGRIGRKSLDTSSLKEKTKLEDITINWECETEEKELINNVNSLNSSYEYSMYHSSTVFIDSKGFTEETSFHHICACMRSPSEIYCAIIDSSYSEKQKSYPISREIAAGDIDRFHIMIGSDKSVKLELSFSFKLDQNKTIESELFEINIWKPQNQRIYDNYIDGDIIKAQLEEKVVDVEKDEWRKNELGR